MKSPKVSDLLGKINRTIENPGFPAISKLELDLLKQHIINLYDELDAPATNTTAQPELTEPAKKETAPDTDFVRRKPIMHANDGMLLNEQPVTQKAVQPVKKETPVTHEEKKVTEKPETKIQKKEGQAVTSSINESIKSGGSLNEKLKTSSAVEIHKKLASKPLKELIDLNKRFVLLNELFKGNTEAYTAAIAHIDTLPDYETAQAFINSQLAANYFWDESRQSTRMFAGLVKMKFGVE